MIQSITTRQLFREGLKLMLQEGKGSAPRITDGELKRLILSLKVDDGSIDRQELSTARTALIKNLSALTGKARTTLLSFLETTPLAKPVGGNLRRADAVRALTSIFSANGEKIDTSGAKLIVAALGKRPAPARLVELKDLVKFSSFTKEAKALFRRVIDDKEVNSGFSKEVRVLTKALLWTSESDREIVSFKATDKGVDHTDPQRFLSLLNEPSSLPIEKFTLNEVFRGQEYFDEGDGKGELRAEQMKKLRTFLETELATPVAFKLGTTQRDVYIVGRLKDGSLGGVVTQTIET